MSDFEVEVKEENTLPSDLSLPNYVPLRREFMREFEQQFIPDSTNVIYGQQFKQVTSMADHYINYILANSNLEFSESILQKYITSLDNLNKVERETKKLKQVHDLPSVREVTGLQLRELNLNSLEEFQKMNNPSFPGVITQEFNNLPLDPPVSTNQRYYKFLKDAIFVINHPEEAIPDENEDDELNISGGTISLKDAITLNYYDNPVCSLICGHTYEDVSIKSHLRTKRTCPIAGCNTPISLEDLKPDKLMLMRIRAATKKDRHNDKNLETVV